MERGIYTALRMQPRRRAHFARLREAVDPDRHSASELAAVADITYRQAVYIQQCWRERFLSVLDWYEKEYFD